MLLNGNSNQEEQHYETAAILVVIAIVSWIIGILLTFAYLIINF